MEKGESGEVASLDSGRTSAPHAPASDPPTPDPSSAYACGSGATAPKRSEGGQEGNCSPGVAPLLGAVGGGSGYSRRESVSGDSLSDSSSAQGSTHSQPPLIPDHQLLRCIGRGSYGEVWLACSVLGEYRAVKVIHRRALGDNRPFEREF